MCWKGGGPGAGCRARCTGAANPSGEPGARRCVTPHLGQHGHVCPSWGWDGRIRTPGNWVAMSIITVEITWSLVYTFSFVYVHIIV